MPRHWDGERQTVQPTTRSSRMLKKPSRPRRDRLRVARWAGTINASCITELPVGLMGGSNSGVDAVRHA
ncbi:hypothetical protein KCP77_09020 [Salmonella enterica subsp. enterica]|nr:hypothetical protein KCP77_09020 [Salmonella enterica subsp. enterica]